MICLSLSFILSRIAAILEDGESPLPFLIKFAKKLQDDGADFIIIPCNTASYYIPEIRKHVSIPVISIVEETVKYILDNFPNIRRVGLLATEATIRVGIYQAELIKSKIEVLDLNEINIDEHIETIRKRYYSNVVLHKHKLGEDDVQVSLSNSTSKGSLLDVISLRLTEIKRLVMKSIFGKAGIKSGEYYKSGHLLLKAAEKMEELGAEAVIMGCTEIPLALHQEDTPVRLINPNQILADVAVAIAKGKNILE